MSWALLAGRLSGGLARGRGPAGPAPGWPRVATATRRAQSAWALTYRRHGPPAEALRLERVAVPAPGPGEVRVRMLAAPVNPADLNVVEGVYPLRPVLDDEPVVGGNEGVGVVEAVGAAVADLAAGDKVIPMAANVGTWREALTLPAEAWMKVPADLPDATLATMFINPCTALRMLEDYVALREGDVLVQNGANSAVGQAVIQLAHSRGIRTINIVRDRPDLLELSTHLRALGATVVTTPDHARRDAGGLPAPSLGLNCVGGSSGLLVAKLLAKGGTMVTYGGMSKRPVTIPTSLLIFKDIKAEGFWLSGRQGSDRASKAAMLEALYPLFRAGALRPARHVEVPLRSFAEMFRQEGAKSVLTMPTPA